MSLIVTQDSLIVKKSLSHELWTLIVACVNVSCTGFAINRKVVRGEQVVQRNDIVKGVG